MRQCSLILVLAALALTGYGQVTSTFNVNAEKWVMHNNAGGYIDSTAYSATSGNPGGAISCPTAVSYVYEYYQSPAKFLINLNDSYNQKLTFDLFVNTAGTDGSNADILFSGGGYVRFYYVFPSKPVANTWTSYSVTLSESDPNWHYSTLTGPAPTKLQWKQVLSQVQQFEIRARYLAGSGGTYSSTLDNVKINKITFQTPPVITAISPAIGIPNTTVVTITGTNFNPTATQDIVFFGGTKATVLSATATQITAKVPTGAQFGRITMVDISTGLQAQSSTNFSPQFNNNNDFGGRIIPASLNPLVNLPLDVATASNVIFQAGDIDGDGWLDILIGDSGKDELSIYQNLQNPGTITAASFSAKQTFPTGIGSAWGAVCISDLDGDGKLDVIMGVNTAQIAIFRNTSTGGAISFAPIQFIAADGYTDGPLHVADIDGDGRPEILSTWANSSGAGVGSEWT